MSKYPARKYPAVGACGLDCGLCPRFYTQGDSRCPGCCGENFWQKHPSCPIITCCVKQKGLESCGLCPDMAGCEKINERMKGSEQHDSFISYRPLPGNLAFIKEQGIVEFALLESARMAMLRHLIDSYDDGRSKGFLCAACQLLPLSRLNEIVAGAEAGIPQGSDIKEKASIIRTAVKSLADNLSVDLRLRK